MKPEDIKYLVVHCSDSPPCRGDTAETIHRWHKEKRWAGIGYHFVVLENGDVEAGRPTYWKGAQCRNHNHESLGICLIGNGDYPKEQLEGLRGLILCLNKEFSPVELLGHRDLDSSKTCPNFDVKSWWMK